VDPADVDRVAVAQEVSVFQPQPVAWPGWFEESNPLQPTKLEKVASRIAPAVGRFPFAWRVYHQLKGLTSRDRLDAIPRILRQDYGLRAPVTFYDHHYCHATGAYFTSGLTEALVVTLDGGGDGLSGSVYVGREGSLERLATVDSFNSLGNLYSYVTALCGFRAERDEGKITGLAAQGTPRHADALRGLVHTDARGRIRYRVPMYHAGAVQRIRKALPADFHPPDLAASMQLVLEEVGTSFVRHWVRTTGLRRVVAAGGVFANVKFNQRVHELDEVDELVVHPAMDDGGLSVGAAMAATIEHQPRLAPRLVAPLANVYLGPGPTERDIEVAIEAAGVRARREEDIHHAIAVRLSEGHVVARVHGRMEYGPRALGHRSILYQANDPSVNDWLNERLQRTEFMPFAPATLVEHAGTRYENLEGIRDTARFMTVTVNCSRAMAEESPGVVHVDGTARPQLVDRDTAPDLHAILGAYHRRTGLPSLVNTSFNMHDEPIVCTPDDALRAFQTGRLDWLALGDYMIERADGAPGSRDAAGSASLPSPRAP
jgi:carbamoyltransferase